MTVTTLTTNTGWEADETSSRALIGCYARQGAGLGADGRAIRPICLMVESMETGIDVLFGLELYTLQELLFKHIARFKTSYP